MTSPADSFPDKVQFQSDLAELPRLTSVLEEWAASRGYPQRLAGTFNICLDEIVTNIIKYGYQQSGREGVIDLTFGTKGGLAEIKVEDDAPAFDPFSAAQPDFDLELEDMPIGGLGIFLTKEMMDEVEYAYVNGRNTLILRKAIEDKD